MTLDDSKNESEPTVNVVESIYNFALLALKLCINRYQMTDIFASREIRNETG